MIGCNLFPNHDLVGIFMHSSPVADERFEESMTWTQEHQPISLLVPEDYRIYVCSDSHIDSTSYHLQSFIRSYRSDDKSEFALHLGDLVNAQGNFHSFDSAMRVLPEGYNRSNRHNDTVFVTAGNHDICFGQWPEYVKYYKTSTYWFETRSNVDNHLLDLFISMDSSSGTVGRKQLAWLRQLLAEKSQLGYRHIIVFTHTHFFKQDWTQRTTCNYSNEETAELTGMFSRYGVKMVWNGHDHSREITPYGGVIYITLDAIQDPNGSDAYYMVADMADEISYRFVRP